MAQPISPDAPARDPRALLQKRLQHAPAEHAEALLAGYEILQGLYDSGLLDLMRGALGSRDQVLDIAAGAAASPTLIRGMRNVLLLIDMFGEIDPDLLKSFTRIVPEALFTVVRRPERPGLWTLVKDFLWNQDFRHGLAAVNTMLEEFGRGMIRYSRANEPT